MKTLHEFLAQTLVGKKIKVYKYDMIYQQLNQVEHYYLQNNIQLDKDWSNIIISESILEIVDITGSSCPYEGSTIYIEILTKENKTFIINANIDDNINIIE